MSPQSRSHYGRPSTSGEQRRAHGFGQQDVAPRPTAAAPEDRRPPAASQDPSRDHVTRSAVLAAVVNLLWRFGTGSVMIAPALGLICASPPTVAPAPDGPPGSGIMLGTEVTVIWMPQALRDLARHQVGPTAGSSSEELQTYLRRGGWKAGWYALTDRGRQLNGEYVEFTQTRRLGEATDHPDELQAVMATAAGRPPRYEGRDFTRARVEIIPDTLQAVDPREAIARLTAEPVGDEGSPTGGLDPSRRTE